MKEKSILLGLNEINFEFIQAYADKGYLPTFRQLLAKHGYKKTNSEKRYELLEPWIQWVSIHTGKTYDEHKVFRLGDIVERSDLKQLWEFAEEKGHTVGAISPFNAKNNLKKPAFFVPDPWTQTTASGSKTVVKLSDAVSQMVNENAHNQYNKGPLLSLLRGFVAFVPPLRYANYLKMVALRLKRKSTKAAILDNLLADTFLTLWQRHKPGFSSLFLNSGAHLQHHYMFNSKVYNGDLKNPEWYCPANEDPMLDILIEYDQILNRLLKLNARLFIATGLHQNPHKKNTFYWRLKNHNEFLDLLSLSTKCSVVPRMSRDFLIQCSNPADAQNIQSEIESITATSDGQKIFSVDNRGDSLFVELIYSKEIKKGFSVARRNQPLAIDFYDHVSFVAIKNGEHDGVGYFVDTRKKFDPREEMEVKDIFREIVQGF